MRALIIDDHYLLVEGYISTLRSLIKEVDVKAVYNCKTAYDLIKQTPPNFYDVVFLDINLPPYYEEGIASGNDLAKIIRQKWPLTKIMVMTSYHQAIILYEINKSVKPEGFLIKSEFTVKDLGIALKEVMSGKSYIGPAARHCLYHIMLRDSCLDNFNRQIILLLSQGIKTKNMVNYMPLSISAIDKRKAQIKDYFLISKGTDEDIVREARKAGLI